MKSVLVLAALMLVGCAGAQVPEVSNGTVVVPDLAVGQTVTLEVDQYRGDSAVTLQGLPGLSLPQGVQLVGSAAYFSVETGTTTTSFTATPPQFVNPMQVVGTVVPPDNEVSVYLSVRVTTAGRYSFDGPRLQYVRSGNLHTEGGFHYELTAA